jgi:hypothetical protein
MGQIFCHPRSFSALWDLSLSLYNYHLVSGHIHGVDLRLGLCQNPQSLITGGAARVEQYPFRQYFYFLALFTMALGTTRQGDVNKGG